jgi:hypothetical protein
MVNPKIGLNLCHHDPSCIFTLGSVGILTDMSGQAAVREEVHNGQAMWIIRRPQGLQLR